MDSLTQLEDWTAPLLAKLSSGQRAKLASEIARDLRHSQQQRIKEQRNPDGSAYAPRKSQQKQGRIKRRAMFTKLRTNKYLKQRTSAAQISVGFFGRVARLASVHQHGLRDRVQRNGPNVQYAQRQLLGFSDADKQKIMDTLVTHLVT